VDIVQDMAGVGDEEARPSLRRAGRILGEDPNPDKPEPRGLGSVAGFDIALYLLKSSSSEEVSNESPASV
jgi:hypothetical protein